MDTNAILILKKLKAKINIPIKAVITALIVFTSVSWRCNDTNINRDDLKTLQLIVNYPIVFPNQGKPALFNTMDTFIIYHYGNYILYRLSPTRNFANNEKIAGTEPYFIYKKNKGYGLLFSSINDTTKGKKMNTDSFLINKAFYTIKAIPGTNDSLAAIETDKKSNIVTECYLSKLKKDESIFDSSYYSFDKNFNNIDYTFSRELDSARGMKLFRIRLLYNGGYSAMYNMVMPKREYLFEIKPLDIRNPDEIITLFERFGKSLQ